MHGLPRSVSSIDAMEKTKNFEHPKGHLVGIAVPKGGSSCANCAKLKPGLQCADEYFQQWNGSKKIPTKDAETYCCDFWSVGARSKSSLGQQLKEQREGK